MDDIRLYFIHLAQVGDIEVLENTLSISPELRLGFQAFKSAPKDVKNLVDLKPITDYL